MRLERLPGIHHDSSCIIISGSDETCIIDPGTTWYQSNLVERLKPHLEQRAPVTTILLTHRHFDTCAAAPYIAEQYGASIQVHEDALAALSGGDLFTTWASRYDSDMPIIDAIPFKDGDMISLGDVEIQILNCPGHTTDSSVFYLPSKSAVICGDLIPSAEHPARADFPTGALNDLLSSLERLQNLKPKMLICGRGKAVSGLKNCEAVLSKHIESVHARIERKGALPEGWPKPAETCHWLTPQPEWDFE
ncbi:MAG: MBL fold metallo-hydrolase [Candidatus Thermoplasmatota archaeon]|nr:MBL fold metallo-hydrolase [Candidatus Thermoplasmatota archaeon]